MLAPGSAIVMPELRAQGSTELLSQFATTEQHVEDLRYFFDSLNLTTVDLVGFSFGGRIALAFAAAYPLRVRSCSVTGVPLSRQNLGRLILQSVNI